MKNLKKVLSLALVFAMVLGLCIGASAAQDVTTLSDWGTVGHQSAAQLLNSFNIMQGYGDKTFRPSRLVTRAEAVKMIDVGLWGGVDQPELFASNEIAFTDVKPTDWYAGHVVYAQALGILDGYPDGSFRPNENVTGYQLLKMALIALNYNSEVEGLTGTGWDIRTMRLATDPTVKNLTAGLSEIKNWNDPLTRDQAAQIIANMITHEYVTYDLNQNGQVGNIKSYAKGTFGKVFLGLTEDHGTLVANAYGNVTGVDDGKGNVTYSTINPKRSSNNVLVALTVAQKNENDETKYVTKYEEASLDSTLADIGRPVTLYYKSGILVGAALDPWTEVEPEYNASHQITNYENTTVPTNHTYTHGTGSDYDVTKYYDINGNGYIDIVTKTNYGVAKKVEDVTTTKNFGTVYQVSDVKWRSGFENGSYTDDKFVVEDEASFTAKKGDYISYQPLTNVFGDTATYGLVLDPVEGTVNRVVNTTTTHTVSVDGIAYPVVKSIYTGKGIAFGTEGTFYLYPNDTIGASEGKTVQTETHYAVIYDAGHAPTSAGTAIGDKQATLVQVCAILDDGTSGIFTVNGIYKTIKNESVLVPTSIFSDSTVTTSAKMTVKDKEETVNGFFNSSNGDLYDVDNDHGGADKLVTYTVNDDGSLNLSIVEKATEALNTGVEITADKPTVKGSSETYYFNSKTLTFVQTKADGSDEAWTVAVGLPTTSYKVKEDQTIALYATNTNDKTAITALVNGYQATTDNGATENEFLYVLGGGAQIGVKDGKPVIEVTVYNSKTDKVETLEVVGADGYKEGAFYPSFANGTFGTEITVAKNSPIAGFITKFADSVIVLSLEDGIPTGEANPKTNDTTYVVTKDTRYYYIDGDSSTEVSASDIGTQGLVDSTKVSVEDKDAGTTTTTETHYYMTVIITDSTTKEAVHVITFANPQSWKTETTTSPR